MSQSYLSYYPKKLLKSIFYCFDKNIFLKINYPVNLICVLLYNQKFLKITHNFMIYNIILLMNTVKQKAQDLLEKYHKKHL